MAGLKLPCVFKDYFSVSVFVTYFIDLRLKNAEVFAYCDTKRAIKNVAETTALLFRGSKNVSSLDFCEAKERLPVMMRGK